VHCCKAMKHKIRQPRQRHCVFFSVLQFFFECDRATQPVWSSALPDSSYVPALWAICEFSLLFFLLFNFLFVVLLMWGNIPTPYGLCSYCHDSYHHVRNCPLTRQFPNYSYGHMDTSFSRLGHNSYFDS
jgi:hypothetical protein